MKRNSRFAVAETVDLFFDPVKEYYDGTLYNGVTDNFSDGEYLMGFGLWETFVNNEPASDGSVVATPYLGGRLSDIETDPSDLITFGITRDAFALNEGFYITNLFRTDLFIFDKPETGYWYCLDGVEHIAYGAGGDDSKNIQGCKINKRKLTKKQNAWGNSGTYTYDRFIETITVEIPASTPEWKIQQMFRSVRVAAKGNSYVSVSAPDPLPSNYRMYKNERGGSFNPCVRLVNINKSSFRYNNKRNVFEVEIDILG